MGRLRVGTQPRPTVRAGAVDPSLTGVSGVAAPTLGHGGGALCTPTSAPCPSTSWLKRTRSMATYLSPIWMSPPPQGGRSRALVPAPHRDRERSGMPSTVPLCVTCPRDTSGSPGLDVVRVDRHQHRGLVTPAYRYSRPRRWAARLGCPRRQSDDRHSATPTHPRPRPTHPPRRPAHPAPTTAPRPARRGTDRLRALPVAP